MTRLQDCFIFLVCSLLMTGCASKPAQTPSEVVVAESETRVMETLQLADPVQLRSDIARYTNNALTDLIGTASNIAANSQDRVVRERALRYKIQAVEGIRLLHREQDPRVLYLMLWVRTVRHRQSMAEGNLFGDQQPVALELAQRLETDLMKIGRKYFGDEVIESANDDIEQLAANTPAMSLVVSSPLPDDLTNTARARQDLVSILRLPLAPIQAAGDVTAGISQLNTTAQLMLETLRNMPQRVRWESELLLLEAESLQVVRGFREDFANLIKQLEETNKIAREIPAELSAETRAIMKDLSDTQPQLQATLQELVRSMEQAEPFLTSLGGASNELQTMAATWATTAQELRGLASDLQTLKGEPDPDAEPGPALEDYAAMNQDVRDTVRELRGLVGDLQQATSSHATKPLLNAILWRGVVLILVAFAAALLYRIVTKRYLRD